MVFAATLLVQALLATAAFAAPRNANSGLARRIAERRSGARQSTPMVASEGPAALAAASSNVTHPQFSSNWAGAVLVEGANTFKGVTGTFVVPTPRVPSGGGSGTFAASAWVGIDGDTCGTAILQTGLDFTVSGGRVSYDAWFEYFPAFATDFTGITIEAGDTVTVTVAASSTTSGTATITNVSRGQTVSKALTSSAHLCQENAEWIVEDFEEGSSLVPFADFGTVTFTNAHATTSSGTTTPAGATIIDLEQNGEVLTSASASSSSVTVTYTA